MLGVRSGKQMSPYLELCCLHLSANMSYAKAAEEIACLSGISVSASTQQRLVQDYPFAQPSTSEQAPLNEAHIDGGKVRIRTPLGQESSWRDYKVIATDQGMVATFQQNQELIDWVNRQFCNTPIACLGDGHDGVWNIADRIVTPPERLEILDWYHLVENLYKVGGSLRRLRHAKALLWQGKVDEVYALFSKLNTHGAKKFCKYLTKHRHRIVNYNYSDPI
jgi:hypothetical protein